MRITMADITRILGVDTAFTARVLVAGPQETPPVVDPVRERDGERELDARRFTLRPAA